MKASRSDIERLVPVMRQVARALVEKHRTDIADDLVHEALEEVVRGDRVVHRDELESRLFMRLVGANRHRLRAEAEAWRNAPGLSAHSDGTAARGNLASSPPSVGGRGLDGLPVAEREVLVLVVLARLDYPRVSEVLGIPVSSVISRLVDARDALGSSLWAAPSPLHHPGRRLGAGHLRLVKS